jgi:D-alanine-D-alanine ligase
VSLASGASVAEGLRQGGHDVVAIEVGRDGVWRCDGAELSVAPGRGLLEADVVFPVLHGPWGEDGTVQGLLECLDVPYVGAGVLASAVCMDKLVFKDLMARSEVPQVAYAGVELAGWQADRARVLGGLRGLGLPVFVKPVRLGSSVGIARVDDAAALPDALEAAFAHDRRVIVEAFADAREVECSVLGDDRPEASEPGEILVTGGGWYDYEAKYQPGGMELVVPARIPDAARERVRALACQAFRRAGCHGLARADFFVRADEVLLNELNTMPGFTQTSVYGKLWDASGLPYPALLERLAGLARERWTAERRFRH